MHITRSSSRFLTKCFYYLSPKTKRARDRSSINTQCTTKLFIRLLPSTTLLPRGETLFHPPLITILELFKYFFACKLVLAAHHLQPEKIQRFFRLHTYLSRKSSLFREYSKTFRRAEAINSNNHQQQPTAATSNHPASSIPAGSSNHPASSIPAATSNHPATSSSNQQQQSTAATSSSNQQQQSTAAVNNSNQQQQSTTTTSSNNQFSSYQQHLHDQRPHLLVITTVPSRGNPARS